jgi:hypothetical protein
MGEPTFIGYIKYSGPLVRDGLMDARTAARALVGFDEAVRYFVGFQDPRLRDLDFEIPVRIRRGSWEALIPTTIGGWLLAGAGIVGTAYLTTAATKLAEKDFDGVSTKDIFRGAIRGIQWTLRIGKHLGDVTVRKFRSTRFRNDNTEIGIGNSQQKFLYVPKKYFDMFVASRPNLLEKMAEVVEDERTLVVGVIDGASREEEKLRRRDKAIFAEVDEEGEEVILPELEHGDVVVLDGDLTRGNETSNTVGLKYRGHILTCHPRDGSIVRFKSALFSRVRIHGSVSRLDEFGSPKARKPHLLITRIDILEPDSPSTDDLFGEQQ